MSLETTLLYMQTKRVRPFFEEVQKSVEAHSQRAFSLTDFKKIHAVADLYKPTWQKTKGEYGLTIETEERLTESKVKARRDQFQKALLLRAITAFEEWAKFNRIEWDLDEMKAWHRDFDPHDKRLVLDVVPASLAIKPQPRRSESVTKFLQSTKLVQRSPAPK